MFPASLFPSAIFPTPLYPGTGKGAVAPVVVPTEPNPAETVWILGPDGAVVALKATPGFAITWDTTLKNNGAVVPFDPADALDASVWRGQQEASLFSPAVAWVDATEGTLSLSIGANQTTTLDKGVYRIQVGVTADGARVLAYDGTLELADTVGSEAVRVPYCTERDMRRYYDQIDMLINRFGDTTGFLDVRVDVSDEIDRRLIKRYNPRFGFVKVRGNAINPASGSMDVASPTAIAPSKKDLTDALAAGGLIVERDLREIAARRAIADILDRQEVEGANGYRTEAQAMRDRADRIWTTYQAQVVFDGTAYVQASTYPAALIDMDVILLPVGTAA